MTFTPSFTSQSRKNEIALRNQIPQWLPVSVPQAESESQRPGFIGRLPILSIVSLVTLALMSWLPARA